MCQDREELVLALSAAAIPGARGRIVDVAACAFNDGRDNSECECEPDMYGRPQICHEHSDGVRQLFSYSP